MDAHAFDRLVRTLVAPASRRRAVGGLLTGALGLLGAWTEEVSAKKKPCPPCKKRKHGKCKANRPDGTTCAGGTCQAGRCRNVPPSPAVVASYCAGSGGSARFNTLGQPFSALRDGRIDRAEVTAREGPAGQYAIEIRDLNQGQGISSAPVLASATVTVPDIPQGTGQRVTAQFTTNATLTTDDQYALVVRYLGVGDNQHYFRHTDAANCAGPGLLLYIPSGQTTFTPVPGNRKLEHTVYVVP